MIIDEEKLKIVLKEIEEQIRYRTKDMEVEYLDSFYISTEIYLSDLI